jgi:flagellar motor switch protein FliM
MGRILTQEEIDALLATPASGARTNGARDGAPIAVPYNFRRPDRVSKEQLHALHMVHERFARLVSTSMSAYLRTLTELSVSSVEQRAYSEFLDALPDPTAFYAIGLAAVDEMGALEINPIVAFAMIDRMLGGTGQTAPPGRALTEIEQHVMDSVVKLLLDALSEAWKQMVDLQFDVRARDTRPQMLQVAAPNETVLMVAFEMRVGDARGRLHLCLPASLVESSGSPFAQAWNRQRRKPTDIERRWVTESLSRVPMDICAQVESMVNARELLDLGPGDILSLGVAAHKPIDVHVGQTLKFKGRLSVEGDRVGLLVESHATAGTAVEV